MLIIIIIIGSIILILLLALFYLKNDAHFITRFLKENPTRSSLYIIRNEDVVISRNEKQLMPLASTVKLLIAYAYTINVSQHALSGKEQIDIDDVNRFYLPGTDANAHKNWLDEMERKTILHNNLIVLDEVVKGMIRYSSNANAEYLIDKLGIDSINKAISEASINDHTPIYPFVSSLIASQKPDKENLVSESWAIHERLKNNDNSFLESFKIPKLPDQKIWSDKLPASTTKDYCSFMHKINTGRLPDKNAADHLKEILAWPFDFNPINKKHFTSLGMKGGSTAFVVTETLFASDKSGTNTALAIFFNDLADWERIIINWNLNKFERNILLNEKFRIDVVKKLSIPKQ